MPRLAADEVGAEPRYSARATRRVSAYLPRFGTSPSIRNGRAFYQRVSFSCGGRKINSWALLFPATEKATYEPIIEQVHRSYRVSDRKCG